MVSAGGFCRAQLALIDPLLESGVTDAQNGGSIARPQQLFGFGAHTFTLWCILVQFQNGCSLAVAIVPEGPGGDHGNGSGGYGRCPAVTCARSEEHTSELQSL